MAFQNTNQLFLLADHIKLSLLERQRAVSLNLEPGSQDGHISRSLESLSEGLEKIAREQRNLEDAGESDAAASLQDSYQRLQAQYHDLRTQFYGPSNNDEQPDSLTHPNDPLLAADFARASERPHVMGGSTSSLKKTAGGTGSKSVRFSEPMQASGMVPYRDNPDEEEAPDHGELDNQQIHEYHSRVMAEQDEALERLGQSIGRQRELSIQMGDELDSQVELLDTIDGQVDRHQSNLDRAKRNLGTVARRAAENTSMTIIVILIIILVLLIIILK